MPSLAASAGYALTASSLFASRAFLTAFLTAAALRFGHRIPLLRDAGLTPPGPALYWFTGNLALALLGVLAVAECLAEKDSDLRAWLREGGEILRPLVAGAVVIALASAPAPAAVRAGDHGGQSPGLTASVLALLAAAAAYKVGGWRRTLYQGFDDLDPDDSSGFQRVLSWIEDGWVCVALLLLLLYPLVMLVLIGLAMLVLALVARAVARREATRLGPCPHCGTDNYLCARLCRRCGTGLPRPCRIGFFGQAKPGQPADPATHAFRLAEKRRCPACATPLRRRTPDQACEACGRHLLAAPDFLRDYDAHIQGRAVRVLGVSFGLSLLPVIGVIPAVIYYRSLWVAPYQRYVPFFRSFLVRTGVRLVALLLLAFQWVPLLGGASLPLMAMVSHWFFRRSFRQQVARGLAARAAAKDGGARP